MKFVFDQKKEDEISDYLMMTPTVLEAESILKENETNPYGWFKMGMALGLEGKNEEALEAYSEGLMYSPFYAPCYFGRGRRHNSMGHYKAALSDFTMAISLDPSVWNYWYYRATCFNTHGDLESSVSDFEECIKLTSPSQRYVLVHWLYTTYCEMGDYDKAKASLEYTDGMAECPQRNYGYKRAVLLLKGMVSPEEYINIDQMKKCVLQKPGRVELELNGMYYALFWYWRVRGNEEKAREALIELQKVAVKGAFGYTKSLPYAKEMGII